MERVGKGKEGNSQYLVYLLNNSWLKLLQQQIRMEAESLNIVLVGDESVGKTSLLMTYLKNRFPEQSQIPVVYHQTSTVLEIDQHTVHIQLWDTSGRQGVANERKEEAYSKADVFIIVFNPVSRVSFMNATSKWVTEVRSAHPNALIMLLASKTDLRDNEALTGSKFIATDEAVRAKTNLYCIYSECCALNMKGVDQTFQRAARQGFEKKKSRPQPGQQTCCLVM